MKFDPKDIDPGKTLHSLDGLANKIPEDIAKLLKKIAVSLFGFFLLVAIYYGWTLGYSDSPQEGLKLAEDTKSIFREEIEKEYNRKRKNIRISEVELELSRKVEERMIREDILRRDSYQPQLLSPKNESDSFDADLRGQKKIDILPPALRPEESTPRETLPGMDESATSIRNLDRLEEKIMESEKATERLEKAVERLERRSLVKP